MERERERERNTERYRQADREIRSDQIRFFKYEGNR